MVTLIAIVLVLVMCVFVGVLETASLLPESYRKEVRGASKLC